MSATRRPLLLCLLALVVHRCGIVAQQTTTHGVTQSYPWQQGPVGSRNFAPGALRETRPPAGSAGVNNGRPLAPRVSSLWVRVYPEVFHGPVGYSVSLECLVFGGGHGQLAVEWTKNGREVGDGAMLTKGGRVLVLPTASLRDTGVYNCSVRGPQGTNSSTSWVFIHQRFQRPKVTVTPSQTKIYEGMSVELHCYANGVPSAVVTWTRIGKPFSEKVMVTGDTMKIYKASVADSGVYACTAANALGMQNEATTNVVVERKSYNPLASSGTELVKVTPQFFEGNVGSRVKLTCSVAAGSGSQGDWIRANGEMPSKTVYMKGNQEIIIGNAQVCDSGVYLCRSRTFGGGYRIAESIVSIHPNFIQIIPRDVSAWQGDVVSLECRVSGNPAKVIQWSLRTGSGRTLLTSNGTSVLRIKTAQPSDSGRYICTVKDDYGTYEASADVTIQNRPPVVINRRPDYELIWIEPSVKTAKVGESVSFSCNTIADTIGNIGWKKNDDLVLQKAMYTKGNKVIVIGDLQMSDSGVYSCFVKTEYGYDVQAEAKLTIVD